MYCARACSKFRTLVLTADRKTRDICRSWYRSQQPLHEIQFNHEIPRPWFRVAESPWWALTRAQRRRCRSSSGSSRIFSSLVLASFTATTDNHGALDETESNSVVVQRELYISNFATRRVEPLARAKNAIGTARGRSESAHDRAFRKTNLIGGSGSARQSRASRAIVVPSERGCRLSDLDTLSK